MRVCCTSDLHGREILYGQLEQLLRLERPDLLVLAGDLFPDGGETDPPGEQVEYVDGKFVPRVMGWRTAYAGLIIACLVGNHDWASTEETLRRHAEAGRIVLLGPDRVWQHGRFRFIGYSCTPPTPHYVKDFERLDGRDDELPQAGGLIWDADLQRGRMSDARAHFGARASLAEELSRIGDVPPPWIFVCHTPPYGSALDCVMTGEHVGSRAVRRFIEQHQPWLALHGHVHEAPRISGRYTEHIGGTLCINPGQSRELLHAVLFEAEQPAETLVHTVLW